MTVAPAHDSARPPGRAVAAPSVAPAADGRPRVLFLGGLGRSGTTVLERALGELPGTCAVGELVHLWQRGVLEDETCGCGEPFGHCPFWTEVGARAFGGWTPELAERMLHLRTRVDRIRFVPQLVAPWSLGRRRAELDEYVTAFVRLYRAIAATTGGAVVIDSSKHSSLALCLRTSPDVDLRVLHVVRDSRGVAYSWTKDVRRPEATTGEDRMTRYSPARSAVLWAGHNLCLALLGWLGTARRLLRYEDFVAEPRTVLGRIAGFAGLDLADGGLDFVTDGGVQLGSSHTVSGNPVRFSTGPLRLRRDDVWRERLPRRRRLLVSLLTLPLLARYGYLRRPKEQARS
ncbi:hypothetical protein ACU610_24025 [Geodermatophilus sp. URMC 61]|uniref:hypothetical protein n=1 Tax=Geodermatophilus sp. URMC 61 TaxID=3423411 RepID=UPI00406CD19B